LPACAAAVAALLACDQGADEGANEATATSCTIEPFDATWWNQAFPEQTGMFHVELAADVTSANMDAVIGLSTGAASKWASLAAIVRFNPQGTIDARDGSVYRADVAYAYEPGHRYFFRFDVDVSARRYSVWMKGCEQNCGYVPLARDYSFRTEQLSATRLTNVAAFVNPETSARGSLEVCGVTVTKDNTTADGCTANVAGAGFINTPVTASSNVLLVHFRARPAQANMDGVVGIASGDVDAYDDYAASIRFWTNGKVEVRDGDTYRADLDIAYTAGQEFDVRMLVDLASKTYSVYVQSPGIDPYASHVRIASGYRFRPAQARVASLDRVTSVVASSTGRLDACEITGGPHAPVIALRDDEHDVVPLADGGALISNGAKTTRLDANNVPVGSVGVGGQVAIDGAGSYYVARVDGGLLAVGSYTPAFAQRWSVSYAVSGTAFVQDMVIAPNGEVVLAMGNRDQWGNETPLYLVRLGSDGHYIANQALPQGTTAVGLGPTLFVVARHLEGTVAYETYAYANWGYPSRGGNVDGNYTVTKIAVAPDGSFVVAGHLGGAVMFGANTIEPYSNSDFGTWDAFVGAFSPEMLVRFAYRRWSRVTGLATTGNEIAVADEQWTQNQWLYYTVFDTSGNALRGSGEDAFVNYNGRPGLVALAPSGRLYMNVFAPLGGQHDTHHWFLVTLSP
jgi:hypothetical protein